MAVELYDAAFAQQNEPAELPRGVSAADEAGHSKQRRIPPRSPDVHPQPGDVVAVSDHAVALEVVPDRGTEPAREGFCGRRHLARGEEEEDEHGFS
jgi:hypothetical protein